MTVRKGIAAGQPFLLSDWQAWLLRALYERLPETGRLRFLRALIGVARKNGKSLLGSAIALDGLVNGGIGAQVFSCAGSKEQAKIIFEEVKWQVENSRWLSAVIRVYKEVLEHTDSGSVYRVVSSAADLQHGTDPSLVLFDELHVQRTHDLWEAMTSGSGTRIDPLVVAITTAGDNLETLCGELYEYGKRLSQGEEDDEDYGFFWWEATPGCSKWDEEEWRRANPNLGEGLMDPRDMRSQAKLMRDASYRRLRMNQWTRPDDAWVSEEQWQACYGDEDLDWDLPFVAAVDMGLKRDTAALVVAQAILTDDLPDVDDDDEAEPDLETGSTLVSSGLVKRIDRVVVRAWIWKPKKDRPVDVFAVEQAIRDLHATGNLGECAYDPAYFDRSAQILLDEGVNMTEFPQSAARMVPACGDTYELIVRGKIRHAGQPTFSDQVLNAVARNSGEGWRLSKIRSSRKIDSAVALCMSTYTALRYVDASVQVW